MKTSYEYEAACEFATKRNKELKPEDFSVSLDDIRLTRSLEVLLRGGISYRVRAARLETSGVYFILFSEGAAPIVLPKTSALRVAESYRRVMISAATHPSELF